MQWCGSWRACCDRRVGSGWREWGLHRRQGGVHRPFRCFGDGVRPAALTGGGAGGSRRPPWRGEAWIWTVIAHCLAKPGAQEIYPWADAELVAKDGGKAFAFIGMDSRTVGVKCGASADEGRRIASVPSQAPRHEQLHRPLRLEQVRFEHIPAGELRGLLDRLIRGHRRHTAEVQATLGGVHHVW